MKRSLETIAVGTRIRYRSQCRQLWLREQQGYASPEDIERRKTLERLLDIRATDIPGPGRPKRAGS